MRLSLLGAGYSVSQVSCLHHENTKQALHIGNLRACYHIQKSIDTQCGWELICWMSNKVAELPKTNKQTNKNPLLARDIDMHQYIVVSKSSCSLLLGCVRKHVGTQALLSWMRLSKFWIYNNMTFQKPLSFLFSSLNSLIE